MMSGVTCACYTGSEKVQPQYIAKLHGMLNIVVCQTS